MFEIGRCLPQQKIYPIGTFVEKKKEKEKEGKRLRNGRNYIVFHHFLTNFSNAVHTY